ncbi:MAG TPA: tetratricopeptide repeat protein, partial [Tepidisphaeraceae bacterium]
LLLGNIFRDRNQPEVANSFYEVVLVSHPDAPAALLARLGRGLCRTMLKQDEPAMVDLIDLAKSIDQRASREKHRGEVVAGLQQAGRLFATRSNFAAALELMSYEQMLNPTPAPEFFTRLGGIYENRAAQVEGTLENASAADKIKGQKQIRELLTKAGDSYLAYSNLLAGSDDKQYADSLWHGIDLYDRAANSAAAIAALEIFVAERPEDGLTPDAMLRLGRSYQSIGQLDKAINVFKQNQSRYPRSLAASKSAVPLAQAFIARGPDSYAKAETVLVSVLDNNPLLDPSSEDFRNALFELGQLHYRTGRFEESLLRLEEFSKRYPNDDRTGQMLFLMADGYRKSAITLSQKLAAVTATQEPGFDPAEMEIARRSRISKAKGFFDRVVDLYREAPPEREPEKLYYKLSHFYRADCLYDLGDYEPAIALYDSAAFRYQDDPSSLAAYVQIVNAWQRLGKTEQAKAANERAKWVLRRIPPEAFKDGSFSMPKEYWEQWLKWTNESGLL